MDLLRASVSPFDSAQLRFAGDEESAYRIPSQPPGFDTQIPGGFDDSRLVVPRPDHITALDAKRFLRAPTELYGRGGRIAHQGRVHGVPQIGVNEIEIAIEGRSAHLSDDRTVREIWVDNDLRAWSPGSNAWKIQLLDASPTQYSVYDPTVVEDSVDPVLRLGWDQHTDNGRYPSSIAMYDGAGIPLGSLYYDILAREGTAAGARWFFSSEASDQITTVADSTADLLGLSASGTFSPLTPRPYFLARFDWLATVGWTAYGPVYVDCRELTVFGTHGLTKRGTVPNQGFYASDIIQNAVQRWAPLLSIDEIEASTYIIRQFAKKDETSVLDIIEELTALGGGASLVNDWGVYENGFFWRTPGTYGRTWRVRRSECSEPEDEGPETAGRANGVVVTYQDPAGQTFRVGPTGATNVNATSADLLDTDPENPVNKDGGKTWEPVNAGLTDQAGAILIGRLKLLDMNGDKRRGTVKVTEKAYDEAGNPHPAWMIRAGDQVVVEDDDDTAPRRIVSTSYDGGDTVTASIGSVPERTDALLGRLAMAADAAGF